jgi:hypothetical protein
MIASSCIANRWFGPRPDKPSEGKLDGNEGNEGGQGFGTVFEVLGEAPVSAEPGKGALHHPAVPSFWGRF